MIKYDNIYIINQNPVGSFHFQWQWAMAIDNTMIQKGSWGMDQQGTAIGNVMKEKGS